MHQEEQPHRVEVLSQTETKILAHLPSLGYWSVNDTRLVDQ